MKERMGGGPIPISFSFANLDWYVPLDSINTDAQLDGPRWGFDPAWEAKQEDGVGEMFTRMNIPNHPSNTMLLCRRWEEDFDDFNILIDVIREQPTTSELQSFSTRAYVNRDYVLLSRCGPGFEFPHPPLDPIARSTPVGIPAISHLSLFMHARSCLLATCPTEGYTKNEGPETTRSRYCRDEEPEFDCWY